MHNQDLGINIYGVNVPEQSSNRDFTFVYKHYHLEIVATSKQENELKDTLYKKGLAVDFKPYDLAEHKKMDSDTSLTAKKGIMAVKSQLSIILGKVSLELGRRRINIIFHIIATILTAESKKKVSDQTPQIRMIEFSVRDETGTLASALHVFGVSIQLMLL